MKNVTPQEVRVHGVTIDGTLYPVIQVLEKATGVDRADFNSVQARGILKRLGFKVGRYS